MIILGEQQIEGLEILKDFLKSNETAFSLVGYAGTGKSLLIKYILEHVDTLRMDYVLCAPTHKAKVVIERFTGREGLTIHKLLALSPRIDVMDLDFRDLRFSLNKNSDAFPIRGVVICDESSMVNDDLFDLLIKKATDAETKIIFIGDSAQIRPVKGVTKSKVFSSVKNTFTLTKIYRQLNDTGLNSVLPTLREKSLNMFHTEMGKEGSLICHHNTKDFFMSSIPIFKNAIENQDIMGAKFLSYTNKRVNALNEKMRQALFPEDNQYNNGEFLTARENMSFGFNKFWNSMDYIVNEEPKKIDISIPGFIPLPGYKLSLYDSSDKISTNILILDKEIDDSYQVSLAAMIDNVRQSAVEAKQRKDWYKSKMAWKNYYKIIESFTTPFDLIYDDRLVRKQSFDYGYACTIHKS